MNWKRLLSLALFCIFAVGCLGTAAAVGVYTNETVGMETLTRECVDLAINEQI